MYCVFDCGAHICSKVSYSKKQLHWTLWDFLEEKSLRCECMCKCFYVCVHKDLSVWASLWTGLLKLHLTILPPLVASYSLNRYFGIRRTPMRLLTSNSMGRSSVFSWIWKKKKVPNSQNNQNIFIETRKVLQRNKHSICTHISGCGVLPTTS